MIKEKVLITGITGFVGSHLTEYILKNKEGVKIYGLKRWRSSLENLSKTVIKDIYLIDGDIKDGVSMNQIIESLKPDRIFHLAAQSYVPYSFNTPRDTFETNAIGTLNLLEAIRESKNRDRNYDPVVHVCSSSEVYGKIKKEEIPIREDKPVLNPQSPYAVSKAAEDLIAQQYFCSYNIKTIRTRAFTHTGPKRGEVFAESSFAKQIAEIENGKTPKEILVGNLDSVRTFCDVLDVCRAYWLVTERGKPGEVYNVGGIETMTVGEMLGKLLAMSNEKINYRVDPNLLRPSDVTLQIPSIEKIKKDTGWEPEIPFQTTLENLLNFWRKKIREI